MDVCSIVLMGFPTDTRNMNNAPALIIGAVFIPKNDPNHTQYIVKGFSNRFGLSDRPATDVDIVIKVRMNDGTWRTVNQRAYFKIEKVIDFLNIGFWIAA